MRAYILWQLVDLKEATLKDLHPLFPNTPALFPHCIYLSVLLCESSLNLYK